VAKLIEEEGTRFSDPNDLNSQVQEYLKLKASMAILEARQKELRDKLFTAIDEAGEVDDKGNINLDLSAEIDGVVRLEKQCRVTRKIDELKADEVISENGLDDVYKTVRVIDEDALMAAHYEGRITADDLDAMFPPKVVWALTTKKK
jgi:hypothetical protein